VPVTPLQTVRPGLRRTAPPARPARPGRHGTGLPRRLPDERAVAVKVLRDGFPDHDARRRFRSELEALRRVRGPHLVEVLDADVEADLPYLVTRFVPGTRLDDLVTRTGPLPLEDLHRVAAGSPTRCRRCTRRDRHRDLTPGNVLVLDGQPHVIDLGLATAADVRP
jgi:serine/threonine protein kinase